MGIADELITRGWCQKALEDDEGRVCLLGAAIASSRHGGAMAGDISQEYLALMAVLPEGWGSIPEFNNARSRTFDEVLRVAKEADEILDAQRCGS